MPDTLVIACTRCLHWQGCVLEGREHDVISCWSVPQRVPTGLFVGCQCFLTVPAKVYPPSVKPSHRARKEDLGGILCKQS